MATNHRRRAISSLKRLRDHPNTSTEERQAAKRGLARLSVTSKVDRQQLCWPCAHALGLVEADIMTFSADRDCSECGEVFWGGVSEDWRDPNSAELANYRPG